MGANTRNCNSGVISWEGGNIKRSFTNLEREYFRLESTRKLWIMPPLYIGDARETLEGTEVPEQGGFVRGQPLLCFVIRAQQEFLNTRIPEGALKLHRLAPLPHLS